MESLKLHPKVDETQEFIEIANDFSNPLDLVREAISNAFDADAKKIEIIFNVINEYGENNLEIRLKDDGNGMDKEGLQSFFDLGNSLSREKESKIGEKGHGTKVYFNSSQIEVKTTKNGFTYDAVMKEPLKKLYKRKIPVVNVDKNKTPQQPSGTEIIIKEYNANRRDKFTHEELKDYILWFTKMGSFEKLFETSMNKEVMLYLKGVDKDTHEEIEFGHPFPPESASVKELFDKHLVAAPDYYCKSIIKRGRLKNFPEISFEAVFSIEGNKVKQANNSMIRRQGMQPVPGSYNVQDRYGIWLCKDFIPVQRKNEWITTKGSEYTKFHAFINCQALSLTANRGSVDNTPSEKLSDLKNEVKAIYNKIVESDDWTQLTWLESEAIAYRTSEKEKKEFEWRVKKIKKSNIAEHKEIILVEPERESGVFALTTQLSIIEPDLLPFIVLDYDTHSGIDVIVKGDDTTPIQSSKLYYVEFKYYLSAEFNHSFENLHSIICWDTTIKHGDILKDIKGEERRLEITQPLKKGEYTKYLLNNPRSIHKIEVYVLKDYLKQKLGIDFRPRTEDSSL